MIRAKGKNGTRDLMILGLSAENVKRLQEGKPVLKAMDDVGFPELDLLVLHGETEDDIREDLKIVTRGQANL